jgi:hypothetical protein
VARTVLTVLSTLIHWFVGNWSRSNKNWAAYVLEVWSSNKMTWPLYLNVCNNASQTFYLLSQCPSLWVQKKKTKFVFSIMIGLFYGGSHWIWRYLCLKPAVCWPPYWILGVCFPYSWNKVTHAMPLWMGLKSLYGAFQHHDFSGLLYSYPNKFPHSSPEAPRIIQMRETSTSEGGNYYQFC